MVALTMAAVPTHAQVLPRIGAGMKSLLKEETKLQKKADKRARAAAARTYQYARTIEKETLRAPAPAPAGQPVTMRSGGGPAVMPPMAASAGANVQSLNAANTMLQRERREQHASPPIGTRSI